MKRIVFFSLYLLTAFPLTGRESKTLEARVATKPSQRIEIEGFSGSDIAFKSWDKDEVYIKLAVSVSSSDDEYEKNYISSAKITETEGADFVRFTFEHIRESTSGWSFLRSIFRGRFYTQTEISGEIYVPRTNPLSTDMKYAAITLENMNGEIRLSGKSNDLKLLNCSLIKLVENDYGTTTIGRSGGYLELNGASSTVTVEKFDGEIDIDADYSEISVSGVNKGVSIKDKSGKIEIDGIAGDVSLDAEYSSIGISDIKGFVAVKSKSATVKARTVGGISVNADYTDVDIADVLGSYDKPITVTGKSGSLRLENAAGDVIIDNPYSAIDLRRITGDIRISSKSSGITAEGIKGDWNSETEYSSVKIKGLSAESVKITNKSDAIEIDMIKIPCAIDIKNKYGDVVIGMPAGYSGDIDLTAEYGSIETNLPVRKKSMGSSEYASVRAGTGSGSIRIETKSASIELREE